jgi:hypothetical protein
VVHLTLTSVNQKYYTKKSKNQVKTGKNTKVEKERNLKND